MIHEWIYLCASYISLLKYGYFPLSQSDFIRWSICPRDFPNCQCPISLLSCSFTHSQPQSIQALTGSSLRIFIHHEAHSLFVGFLCPSLRYGGIHLQFARRRGLRQLGGWDEITMFYSFLPTTPKMEPPHPRTCDALSFPSVSTPVIDPMPDVVVILNLEPTFQPN